LPFCEYVIKVPIKALRLRTLRKNGLVEIPNNLGEHLRNRRLTLGLTQKQVAIQLGTVREVYERWERNERVPGVSVWPAIITFLSYYPDEPDPSANLTLMTRRHTGLDQKQLAKRVGVIHLTLRDWEREHQRPSEDQIRRLNEIAEAATQISKPSTPTH
jgi:transcriptional regulator with XRE-family HTH domain